MFEIHTLLYRSLGLVIFFFSPSQYLHTYIQCESKDAIIGVFKCCDAVRVSEQSIQDVSQEVQALLHLDTSAITDKVGRYLPTTYRLG